METITNNTISASSKLFNIHSAEIDFGNNTTAIFEYLSFKSEGLGVMMLALDKDNNIYLVEQYQVGAKKRLLVLPRGGVKEGENLIAKANIELQEEIGYAAKNIEVLTEIEIFPGYVEAKSYLLLCRELEVSKLEGDELEDLVVHKIPFQKAIEMIIDGTISDSRTISGIFFGQKYLSGKN